MRGGAREAGEEKMDGGGREWKGDVSQESQKSTYTCYVNKYYLSVPNFDTREDRPFCCAC